jgi:hypothetical protein
MSEWAFTVTSDVYGREEFRGYSTAKEAREGIKRVKEKAIALNDGVQRQFSKPYQIKTVIQVICAWCGKSLGQKDGEGIEGISHGICPECEAKQERA